MAYLYGDSTPSTLDENFIEFLRDFIDSSVTALSADERARQRAERTAELREAANADNERLKQLGATVESAVESSASDPESPAGKCAAEILRSTRALVASARERVASGLEQEVSNLDEALSGEREKCIKALEDFLFRHDLPKSTHGFHLGLQENGYLARRRSRTVFGVSVEVEIEVPDAHPLSKPLRVDAVTERLEVHAPDSGGWLHREGKVRAQRLEKLYVAEVGIEASGGSIGLRTQPESMTGIDISLGEDGVALVRVSEREGASAPFQVNEADDKTLRALHDRLEAFARELGRSRKAFLGATLDEVPLRDHDSPAVLVERIIASLAPTVQEIAKRSPSAGELVLKRLLTDNRREEIFVTKAELREKLESLSPVKRALFDPLGLNEGGAPQPALLVPPPLPRSAPPPPVRAEPSRKPPAPDSRLPPLPRPKPVAEGPES